MTRQEASERWESSRRRIRERASRLTPKVLTNYPFEVAAAVIALCMGLPFLAGAAAPASLLALVGPIVFHLWAIALSIGGLTVSVGLHIGDRHTCHVLAAGLQLLGGSFGVYALAAVVALGLAAWTAVIAFGTLGLLAWVRATHFRRIIDIQRGADRLRDAR